MKQWTEDEIKYWVKFIFDYPDNMHLKIKAKDLKELLKMAGIEKEKFI